MKGGGGGVHLKLMSGLNPGPSLHTSSSDQHLTQGRVGVSSCPWCLVEGVRGLSHVHETEVH